MRIEDLGTDEVGSRHRVAATVTWEDCDRAPQRVFFETEQEYAPYLGCNPHAFLVAGILPAMRHGEKRVAMREAICPELRIGLETAMRLLCSWYGAPRQPVTIESRAGIPVPPHEAQRRAGVFLSGGLDSLAVLWSNRQEYPLDHPNAFQVGILVHGFDMGAFQGGAPELAKFEQAMRALQPIAADAHVLLLPVYTNVRHLADEVDFWMHEFHAAALSSVAHACSSRLHAVGISSTSSVEHLHPWGSHPLLDPLYSSADLRIKHEGLHLSRLEKAKLVGEWEVGFQALRVCWTNPAEELNCGACEKCLRTMVELMAAGKLAQARAFPTKEITAESILPLPVAAPYIDAQWLELVGPLRELGRDDLAKAIEERSARYRRHLAWEEERDWKGAVKRLDRRFLRGGIYRFYKTARQVLLKRRSG